MSILDNEIVQSYINFATQDGTVHDAGANLLLYGPVAIAALALVVGYQFAAMALTGVWRTLRGAVNAGRYVAGRVGAQRVATPISRSGAAGTGAGTGSTAPAVVPQIAVKRTPAKVG